MLVRTLARQNDRVLARTLARQSDGVLAGTLARQSDRSAREDACTPGDLNG